MIQKAASLKSQPIPNAMSTAAKNNGTHTTGMMQNPISHPPIACSHDLFGAAAFAFQIAKTLNGVQRAIPQRVIITEAVL